MSSAAASEATGRWIAGAGKLELVLPACDQGLGKMISALDSRDVIAGVRIAALPIYPDDRGYFLEIQRLGQGLAAGFPAGTSQISAALGYPGTIKAFHFHLHQTDCWTPVKGLLQVALVDLRANSPTFGVRNTMYVGPLRPWQVLIPPGVAHGYKVIGADDSLLVYMTDRFYNPHDEGRIPYDNSSINYDWETQRK
jgi:dTDP-4-dehydrorhamnose 3,5-epimerase